MSGSGLCCKKCGSKAFVKSGHIRGHQRYRCKTCGCQFTATARRGVHPALKAFAIVFYALCGVSMGKIARMFGVSTVAVLKWIRARADSIEPPAPHAASGIVKVDEMSHFVDGKKKALALACH